MASNPHQPPISEVLYQALWRVVAGCWPFRSTSTSARSTATLALLSLNCAAVIGCPGRRKRQSNHTVHRSCRSEDARCICVARGSVHLQCAAKRRFCGAAFCRVSYLALPISLYFSVRGRGGNPPALDPRSLSWRSSRAVNHASARSHIMKMRIVLRIERMARAKFVLLSVSFTLFESRSHERRAARDNGEKSPLWRSSRLSRPPAPAGLPLFFVLVRCATMYHEPRTSGLGLIQPSALSLL